MKILLVNKFLYPKGGAETYVFKLGDALKSCGHSVEFFGLDHEDNIVTNSVGAYVSHMDFSEGTGKNLSAPFRIIYSREARKKLRLVLDDFQPDIVHFNNIQFHLTPSMLLEVEDYRKSTGRNVRIIYTAHDYQLICPSHGLFDADINICEKCLGGNYMHCFRTKCHKNSRAKSLLAMADAYFWKFSKAYSYIDTIICPSKFLKSKLDTQERFRDKTITLHNFIEKVTPEPVTKEKYVLEFGHLSRDKGTETVLQVARRMPDVNFVFAGYGESEASIAEVENATYVGFKTGDELKSLIGKAAVSICPSEIYENCPYTVIESQMYLTPVVGANIGGIPELIENGRTGLLFTPGDADDLEEKLRFILFSDGVLDSFTENCRNVSFETAETYCQKLMQIYGD
ncbi:MAG: glycosyltransferase [Ruminococcus sp.]|nr:glycosyltransferase [Ruminococcus sp.]